MDRRDVFSPLSDSLLHSLEFVNSDAARLREHNFTLIRENVVSLLASLALT